MSKQELALELTKLSYKDALSTANSRGNYNVEEIVTKLYNHILNNITYTEQSK